MNSEQASLFNAAGNPLQKRIGKDFFEALPKEPGVYLMYSRRGQLLYVGKAKNLRTRLFSYRRLKNGEGSQKIRRLIRMVTEIEIVVCESEQAALLKENALIRSHKPAFNHAKKSPETYYYLTLHFDESYIHFRLGMQLPKDRMLRDETYGAFKGHRSVRKGTGALLRQLYLLEHEVNDVFCFPTVLTNKMTPMAYKLPLNGYVTSQTPFRKALRAYLEGQSVELLQQLVTQVHQQGLLGEYIGRLILKDCESLKQFYDRCLHRNREVKETLGLEERIIPQMKLDDYLIQTAFTREH